jgi:hypothetical protein
MTTLVPLVLLGWIALALVLFARLPRPQALVAVFVLGELFLPEVQLPSRVPEMPPPLSLPGMKLTKINAICYAALLGALVFDWARCRAFRFRWFDVPMAAWCASPVLSSLANGLGLYDGISQALNQTMTWGMPYFLGRLYLGSPDGFRLLATGIVLGALLYVPFCLFEVRMSPQLHRLVYGYHQHDFLQTLRFGGYRPMVFMEHGLAVSLWMVTAALLALWLWWTGATPVLEWPPGRRLLSTFVAAGVLFSVAVLCKSTGALALGAVGAGALLLTRLSRRTLVIGVLLAVAPAYLAVRATGAWSGADLTDWVARHVSEERAQSLEFRLDNEDALVQRTLERPTFGWGGWGRAHVLDDEGKDTSVTDSLWIIAFSDRGAFGLTAIYLALLLPAARFVWLRGRLGSAPDFVPAVGGAVILALCVVDSLFNAQVNPVFLLASGNLAGLAGVEIPQRIGVPAPQTASSRTTTQVPAWRRVATGSLAESSAIQGPAQPPIP